MTTTPAVLTFYGLRIPYTSPPARPPVEAEAPATPSPLQRAAGVQLRGGAVRTLSPTSPPPVPPRAAGEHVDRPGAVGSATGRSASQT